MYKNENCFKLVSFLVEIYFMIEEKCIYPSNSGVRVTSIILNVRRDVKRLRSNNC